MAQRSTSSSRKSAGQSSCLTSKPRSGRKSTNSSPSPTWTLRPVLVSSSLHLRVIDVYRSCPLRCQSRRRASSQCVARDAGALHLPLRDYETIYHLQVVVDAVCSVASEEIQMDAWGIDAVLTASQKGLGTPPGLSIVVISQKALKVYSSSHFFVRFQPTPHLGF